MTSAQIRQVIMAQLESAVCTLGKCVAACPENLWDGCIAKYPFWHVAYHALCFVDCYLAAGDDAWAPHPKFHPAGRAELAEEYPSRRFTQAEILEYVAFCRQTIRDTLGAETDESLQGPSGFPWLPFSRAELHLYNLRHAQHHAGQLSAFLHRNGVNCKWVKSGWVE